MDKSCATFYSWQLISHVMFKLPYKDNTIHTIQENSKLPYCVFLGLLI